LTQWDFLSFVLKELSSNLADAVVICLFALYFISVLVEKFTNKSPISLFLRKVGEKLNTDTNEHIGSVESKVDTLQKDLITTKDQIKKVKDDLVVAKQHEEENNLLLKAETSRHNILLFSDEILRGVKHSKEHYIQINADIRFYNNYTEHHPEFENERTVDSSKIIKLAYERCLEQNSFLRYKED
jgi:hypothetical protein